MTSDQADAASDLVATLVAAMSHPDPWFSALARAYLTPREEDPGVDQELAGRLAAQAASGTYQGPTVAVADEEVAGPHGAVPVRVYRPDDAGPGVVVWCHGGGFVGGDLQMPEADATAREVAARAGIAVVSVGYRLAVNGVHFPVPHDDVHAAFTWAADTLGGPAFLGGASAGGNLAAGVALRLRDEGRPPAGALLVYSLVHPRLPEPSPQLSEALRALPRAFRFPPDVLIPVNENYLGASVDEATPYAFAALGDLTGFPPTLVLDAEQDGLRASGEAFAAALREKGVEVEQHLARDVAHGHLNAPWLPQAQQSYADLAAFVVTRRRATGPDPSRGVEP